MLVLSRKEQGRIKMELKLDATKTIDLGYIEVLRIVGNRVKLGFESPDNLRFTREELEPEAAATSPSAG